MNNSDLNPAGQRQTRQSPRFVRLGLALGALLVLASPGCRSAPAAVPGAGAGGPEAAAATAPAILSELARDAVSGSDASSVTVTLIGDASQRESRDVVAWWLGLDESLAEHVRFVFVPYSDVAKPASVRVASELVRGLHREGPGGLRDRLEALVRDDQADAASDASAVDGAGPVASTWSGTAGAPFVPERLAYYREAAAKLGVRATPAVFVEGRGLPSLKDAAAFRSSIVEAGRWSRAQEDSSYAERLSSRFRKTERTRVGVDSAADSVDVVRWDASSKVPIFAEDPSWGRAGAPVTLVELSDFQCPFCARVQPTLAALRERYGPEQLRIVWKDNPLPFHERARPAALAAHAVHVAGGDFWTFHDLAFANQKTLSDENFAAWAQQAGAAAPRFLEVYHGEQSALELFVERGQGLAEAANLRGTPSFLINGRSLSGAQPVEHFAAIIDEELDAAGKLLEAGTAAERISYLRTQENFQPQPPREAPAEQPEDTTIYQVPVAADDPVLGPNDALVTVVEWSDFQCPFCKRVEPTLAALVERYGDDLRIVWKDNPLPFHDRAGPAARLARLAYKSKGNKAFWAVHDQLFGDNTDLSDERLLEIGKNAGLSSWAIKNVIKSDARDPKVDASLALAQDLNARGTPHFFINGQRLAGAQAEEKFVAMIDVAMARARALVADGTPRAKVYAQLMATAKGPEPFEMRPAPAVPADAPSRGPASAKVTVQVFSDFQCPFCSRALPTLDEIRKRYPQQVRIVYRHYPLPFHKEAPLAAEAALEAYAQQGSAGFWKFHDVLYADQTQLSREDLERHAEAQGLVMSRFRAALDDHIHAATVERDLAAGSAAGVQGTPSFFINDFVVPGAQPFSRFQRRIDALLKPQAAPRN